MLSNKPNLSNDPNSNFWPSWCKMKSEINEIVIQYFKPLFSSFKDIKSSMELPSIDNTHFYNKYEANINHHYKQLLENIPKIHYAYTNAKLLYDMLHKYIHKGLIDPNNINDTFENVKTTLLRVFNLINTKHNINPEALSIQIIQTVMI